MTVCDKYSAVHDKCYIAAMKYVNIVSERKEVIQMPMIMCSRCGKLINTRAGSCCRCGEQIADKHTLEEYELLSARKQRNEDMLSICFLVLTVGLIVIIIS